MNHDETLERLPWYLNRTLDPGERREVEEHLAGCYACRRALAETREAGRIFTAHLPPGALVALAWEEDPPGVGRELAERHLAECPQCAAELELARTSRRLEEESNVALFPSAPARKRRGLSPTAPAWRVAAAAGLAAVVGLAGWIQSAGRVETLEERLAAERPAAVEPAPPAAREGAGEGGGEQLAEMAEVVERLRREQMEVQETARRSVEALEETRRELEEVRRESLAPQALAWVDLFERDARTRASAEAEVPEVAADRASALSFEGPARAAGPVRAEVLDAEGRLVQAVPTPLAGRDGFYSLAIPAGSLAPGRYTLRLTAGDEVRLYDFRVVR